MISLGAGARETFIHLIMKIKVLALEIKGVEMRVGEGGEDEILQPCRLVTLEQVEDGLLLVESDESGAVLVAVD